MKNANHSLRSNILKQNDYKCSYCQNQANKVYASCIKGKELKASKLPKSAFACLCDTDSENFILWAKLSTKEKIIVRELTEEGELKQI